MDDDRETRSQAIAVLLGGAETSGEINAISRVARRTGFLWRCKCRDDHYPTAGSCRACGSVRPDDV